MPFSFSSLTFSFCSSFSDLSNLRHAAELLEYMTKILIVKRENPYSDKRAQSGSNSISGRLKQALFLKPSLCRTGSPDILLFKPLIFLRVAVIIGAERRCGGALV